MKVIITIPAVSAANVLTGTLFVVAAASDFTDYTSAKTPCNGSVFPLVYSYASGVDTTGLDFDVQYSATPKQVYTACGKVSNREGFLLLSDINGAVIWW